MRGWIPPALMAMAISSSASAQQDISGSDESLFRMETYSVPSIIPGFEDVEISHIVHDKLSEWAAYLTGGAFEATVSASEMSQGLSRAEIVLRCEDSFAGRNVSFRVSYVLEGGSYPREKYVFDLFNSALSDRRAAFNIGDGFVRTDHIEFYSSDQPPREYFQGTLQLWSDLQLLSEDSTIEVRFETFRVAGPYVSLAFPMDGFSRIAAQAKDFCP